MARFFVGPNELCGEKVILTGDNAEHAKVLRLKIGEIVTVEVHAGAFQIGFAVIGE